MNSAMRWLAGLALLGFLSVANAACPMPRPIQAGTYEFGINYNPKAHSGLDLDILDELSRRTGCRFEPVYESRVRLWQQFTDGKLDMMVSVLETPDRDQYARFVLHSWARSEILAQPRANFPATPEAFLADHSLMLGAVNSYRYSPGVDEWVNTLRAQHRTYDAPDVATLLKVFDGGRVAAIPVGPEARALITSGHSFTRPVQKLDWFSHSPKAGGGLALSRARLPEAVAASFGQAMKQMRGDGTLARIARRYFDPETAAEYLNPD